MENTMKDVLLKLEQAAVDAAVGIFSEAPEEYEIDDEVNSAVMVREEVLKAFVCAIAEAWGISENETYAYMLHDVIHDPMVDG